MRRSSQMKTLISPSSFSPLLLLLCLSALALIDNRWAVEANFHTEGGNFKFPPSSNGRQPVRQAQLSSGDANQALPQYYDVELGNTAQELYPEQRDNTRHVPTSSDYEQSAPVQESGLAGIVDEMNQQMRRAELYDELNAAGVDLSGLPVEPEQLPKARNERVAEQSPDAELEELRRFGQKFKELTEQQAESTPQQKSPEREQKSEPEVAVEKPTKHHNKHENLEEDEEEAEDDKPLTAQKKGQSEFVEFVEPVHAKKLKNKEFMEKRIADGDERHSHHSSHSHRYRAFNFLTSSGNVIFIAFVTMCCVFSVVGVVGGMYYYNHIRTSREDPFDDFTRYSPAGPGRDKLKKGRGGAHAFGGFEKGDDSLAYKAQLHHYQQTKQKIIGEQGAIGGIVVGGDPDASDKSDDEADLEHNFSVYECPGLAPTGDIEVQNPNFIESPTSQSKKKMPQ